MKYDLLQIIKDRVPSLDENIVASELVHKLLEKDYSNVKKIGEEIELAKYDNDLNHLIKTYVTNESSTIKIIKETIQSKLNEEISIIDKNKFIYSFYNETLIPEYKIIQACTVVFDKAKIINSKLGIWHYDLENEIISTFNIRDFSNHDIVYDYYACFQNLEQQLYKDNRVLPDYSQTFEINNQNNDQYTFICYENKEKLQNTICTFSNTDILEYFIKVLNTYVNTINNINILNFIDKIKQLNEVLIDIEENDLIKNDEDNIKNILIFYLQALKLTDIIRSGWNKEHWNVKKERLESIAEHTYKSIMLAIAMHSEYNYKHIDLNKVITMLAIHELGETKIGDITDFDGIDANSKKEKELLAFKEVVSTLNNKEYLIDLFVEFEAKETPEAKFAFLCDKEDCDITAKVYEDNGYNHLDGQEHNPTYNCERVQEILKQGFNTVADCFIEYDAKYYQLDNNFMKVLRYIQKNNTKKIAD